MVRGIERDPSEKRTSALLECRGAGAGNRIRTEVARDELGEVRSCRAWQALLSS